MVEHDFRYTLMNPQHTLTECRALVPGRYQVTGNGGSIRIGDALLVTLKGSKDLSMRLTVDTVRHLINPPGQWTAMTTGPVFGELAIHVLVDDRTRFGRVDADVHLGEGRGRCKHAEREDGRFEYVHCYLLVLQTLIGIRRRSRRAL